MHRAESLVHDREGSPSNCNYYYALYFSKRRVVRMRQKNSLKRMHANRSSRGAGASEDAYSNIARVRLLAPRVLSVCLLRLHAVADGRTRNCADTQKTHIHAHLPYHANRASLSRDQTSCTEDTFGCSGIPKALQHWTEIVSRESQRVNIYASSAQRKQLKRGTPILMNRHARLKPLLFRIRSVGVSRQMFPNA